MKHQDVLAQLARETERARKTLALERALRAGLWTALAAGLWALAALAGLQDRLPPLAQSLSTVFAVAALIWLGHRAWCSWRAPTEAEARARLAADSRLDAGVFDALHDRPSRFDGYAMALWRRELERACARAARAHAGPSRPDLDALDRFKLRYLVPAALIAAFLFAGADAPDRLTRAFIPDPGPLVGDGPLGVEAWATPAAYTHGEPVSLSDRLGERIETPPTVEATVRVTGPRGAPKLVFDGTGGHREARFALAADGAWEAHLQIPGPGRLKIVRFLTRGSWLMAPSADAPPRAVLSEPLAAEPNERVTLGWQARDDYGVVRTALRVRPVNPPPGLIGAPPVDTPLETPAGDLREAQGSAELDMAAHPYAGMEVEASVVAFDALGQAGESEAMRFTMPEKVFLQPLAQAAIEIRRQILWERRPYRPGPAPQARTIRAGDILLGNQRIAIRDDARHPSLMRAPPGIRRAADLDDALTMLPQDGYFRDLAVFLGLRRARSELDVAQNIGQTDEAADILWQTALRAEYGGAADAREALEAAQRALAEALQNGASKERIAQLTQALWQATDRYLQSMIQQALRNGQTVNREDTQDQTQVTQQDIENMLQQVQRLTEQGRTQEAQALLNTLANILRNLDARMEADQSGSPQQQGQGGQEQQAQQGMDQLSDTIGQQRALRDETQQQSDQQDRQQQAQQQQNAQGGSGGTHEGGEGGDDLAQRQAQIRQSLAEAQRNAQSVGGQASPDLSSAGQAMRRAENALRHGDLQGAQEAQNAALEHLRQGAEQLAAQLRQQGNGSQHGGQAQTGNRDPLGRIAPSGGDGSGDTQVPTRMDPVRARAIFDEIRRRAQDPNRPEAEREYLRRLLDRFSGS